MSKATIQNVVDEGFDCSMFGDDKDTPFTTPTTGVVQMLLNRASNWVQDKVTAVNYAAAAGYALDCITDAEKYFAAWQLWIRRIAFLDAGATQGLEADKKAALLTQARTNSDKAQADALYWLAEAQRAFGMDVQADLYGTGASTGMIETGMFPQTVNTALNFGQAQ